MPLTPQDVSNKRFTPVRLREGYDMGEVDQFLDEVESELTRLNGENDELRKKLSGADGGAGSSTGSSTEPSTGQPTGTSDGQPAGSTNGRAAGSTTAPAGTAAPAAPTETLKVTTAAEASSAATRLLEIATRNADELVGEARAEADRIVTDARESADKVEADARSRSQMLESETEERRAQLFGDLERERERLNGEVENLRTFEREYRSRLKSYFQEQLAALDGSSEGALLEDAPADRPS
jgi:DivIVA domain-containing protein